MKIWAIFKLKYIVIAHELNIAKTFIGYIVSPGMIFILNEAI